MAQQPLPPYSTFRTDNKQLPYPQAQSNGNILAFQPPGFSQTLWVKFPDSRLAVCHKCKKNFKTRELCRVRNRHSAAPWTTAYICVTVDESCLDEDGKFVDDEMTVRMIQWQPYCVKKPFVSKTPVCASCKKTNRTRRYCRERHKHLLLPWCTVYVLLSTLKSVDPSTVVAKAEDASTPNYGPDDASSVKSDSLKSDVGKSDASSPESTASGGRGLIAAATDADTISSDNGDNGDDINVVPESRTFLAMVSSRATSIHWLELGTVDPTTYMPTTDYPATTAYAASPVDPMQFYNANMGYSSSAQQQQQQQIALKLRQQQQFLQMQQQQLHLGQPRHPQQWQPQQCFLASPGDPIAAGDMQQQQPELAFGAIASPMIPAYYPAPVQQQQQQPFGSENLPVNGGQHTNYAFHSDDSTGEPDSKRQRSD